MEKVNQRGKYLFIAGIISLIIAIVILFIIPGIPWPIAWDCQRRYLLQ